MTGSVVDDGKVHVAPEAHAAAGAVVAVADELDPLMTSPLVERSHGAVDVQFVVPVFAKSVDSTVRFQPSPDPVSSAAVIVSGRPMVWSDALRVADHDAVPGASSPSVPAAMLAVALCVQVPFDVEVEQVAVVAPAVAVITPRTAIGNEQAATANSKARIRLMVCCPGRRRWRQIGSVVIDLCGPGCSFRCAYLYLVSAVEATFDGISLTQR